MTDPERRTDAVPDGAPGKDSTVRRPGEALFAVFLVAASAALLWSAYGISGFRALSAPGSVPMATTAVMLGASLVVLIRTLRLPKITSETVTRDVLPLTVIVLALMLVAYGVLLQPLGFLPTSALFLIGAIKFLSRRSWRFTLIVALSSLVIIWLVFRIVFTVLMPPGLVPEAEFIQIFRDLLDGGT